MPASWPRSAAPKVSATAISTPASSTAISPTLGAAPQGLDRAAAALGAQKLVERESARIAASLEREPDEPASPWDSGDAFQLSGARRLALPILAEGESVVAQIVYGPRRRRRSTIDGIAPAADAVAVDAGDAVYVLRHGRQTKVSLRDLALDEAGDARATAGWCARRCTARCSAFWWSRATASARGQRLAIIEAMKMEHTLHCADRRHRRRDRGRRRTRRWPRAPR